ncbi:transmembrane protein 145-like [Mizuhopecten yessoensis]|uniref:Transmembrane protein 145 n=1 Tax=Mizuhopecten yessoensis TaxID=6573 RepID=A0A210QYJ8_MIZYE|nr:transmembrane protein 145-like [Mizuhopecten yessoensis]OWF53819.1 Transmembrane protein 145 [Mizuhopecten yessoensis]
MDGMWILSLCFAFILIVPGHVTGKRVDGTLTTLEDWHFITRFCFLSEKGRLRYVFEYPQEFLDQQILLYYDDLSQWSEAYPSDKTCQEKVDILKDGKNQIIRLDPTFGKDYWPYCENTVKEGRNYIRCELSGLGLKFRSMRERWWFIAVSRCNQGSGTGRGINLTYNLHLTNGDDGDLLHQEFSADEFYILPILIAFLIAYLIILAVSVIFAVILSGRQLLHSTFKMYISSVILWSFGLFLLCISYGRYADSGYEQVGSELGGRVFCAAAEICFLLMLNLLAKGYTITRGRLPCHSTIKLSVFFTVYVVAYAALFIVEAETFDPALVLYIYESIPGYGLIILRLLAWAWFCYSLFFTLKRFPKRGGFYYPFFFLYTLWFWAGPIVILIAMFAMAVWTREKTVVAVQNFVSFCGHLFFLVLTRPNAAQGNFPYTIKTTQIQAMGNDGGEGDRYMVTSEASSSTGPDLTSLFVTSNTYKPSMAMNGDADIMPPSYNDAVGMNGRSAKPFELESVNQPSSPPMYETYG